MCFGPPWGQWAMPVDPQRTIYYKRARFTTRLPIDRLYSQAHFWLLEEEPGVWRIGLTRFATRMLGDFVELRFEVLPGRDLEPGQIVGSIEGFKAVSDLYSVMHGNFQGSNPELEHDPALLDRDPYEQGWLYRVRGKPPETSMDVHGYIGLLDATVERMLQEQKQAPDDKTC
ncbi:MAG: glycine cleavage system protein H [Planctomycetaceae bacterium]